MNLRPDWPAQIVPACQEPPSTSQSAHNIVSRKKKNIKNSDFILNIKEGTYTKILSLVKSLHWVVRLKLKFFSFFFVNLLYFEKLLTITPTFSLVPFGGAGD